MRSRTAPDRENCLDCPDCGHDRVSPSWLTIDDVAKELRSSTSHVKTLLGQRGGPVQIRHFKHGRRTLITRSDLDAYKQSIEGTRVPLNLFWNAGRR